MLQECHHPFTAIIVEEARYIGGSAHSTDPPGFWPAQPPLGACFRSA
jgi:hypothetical protein